MGPDDFGRGLHDQFGRQAARPSLWTNRGAGGILACDSIVTLEVVIGRTIAYCVHPAAAWRVLSGRGRAAVVGAYAAAGYLAVLVALLLR